MNMRRLLGSAIIIFALTACDQGNEAAAQSKNESLQAIAESLINAFYSFDPMKLEPLLSSAPDSSAAVIYYQGWAEGGNYKILDRRPCALKAANTVSCSIKVEDGPMLALGIDYDVTDTFTISFSAGEITSVETSSDDLQLYYDARDWVRAQIPELIEEPCRGYFAGGPTPGDCARAMAEGYARFADSDEFLPLQGLQLQEL